MKKLMIAAALVLGTSAAFAADSEPLKAITSAKTYAEAVQLLNQNLSQLANSAEKAKAYNHVTKLALEKYDKENLIQTNNVQAQLTKQKEAAYDTLGFYEAAYNATVNGLECIKYDAEPNEKGKVKPKYTNDLTPLLTNARLQLVTAGNYYAQRNDQDNVLKYWGTFLDTDDNPVFAKGKESEKQFIGQVAYYSALYANQAQNYVKAEKYADIAMQDPAMRKQAETFKYAMAERNLKTHADSLAFAEKMKAEYDKDQSNESVFSILCSIYSGLGMGSQLNDVINAKIAQDPKNFTAWAMKGQSILNANTTAKEPNWDECIDAFKHASEIQPENSVVLTYLGFAINSKAAQVNNNADQQKQLFKESLGFLERAKQLDPNREKSNWAYPLYQSYYVVYGGNDARTKELENLVKGN